jgi:hypothetical protein
MAKVIREEPVDETRDVIVEDREDRPRSNIGLIILGIVVLLVLLFLLFGGRFGGGGGDTEINVPSPEITPTTPAPTTNTPGQ